MAQLSSAQLSSIQFNSTQLEWTHLILQAAAEGFTEVFCNLLDSDATHRTDGKCSNERVLLRTYNKKDKMRQVSPTRKRLYPTIRMEA